MEFGTNFVVQFFTVFQAASVGEPAYYQLRELQQHLDFLDTQSPESTGIKPDLNLGELLKMKMKFVFQHFFLHNFIAFFVL